MRVTRLGEFFPLGDYFIWAIISFGRLFHLGSFSKIRGVAQIFGLFFPNQKLSIKLDKIGLGNFLGDYFTNSSGHLAHHILFKW
jgi:hypothetical protein